MDIILNPMIISIVIMIILCLINVNVFIAISVAGLICGLLGGVGIGEAMTLFVDGMGSNSEIVFCMMMFGILAVTMEKNDIGAVLVPRVSRVIRSKKWLLPIAFCLMGIISETFILIYVAFVPIIVPPLLALFNQYKIDRRLMIVVILAGMQIGYVCVPAGFGRIFQDLVLGALADNGLEVEFGLIWKSNLVTLVAFAVAIILAMIIYGRPREYTTDEKTAALANEAQEIPKMEWKHWGCILATLAAVVVQVLTDSMPLGAFCSLLVLLVTGAIPWKNFASIAMDGMMSMAFVALALMAATGFANVCREVGKVDSLVSAVSGAASGMKLIGAFAMLLLGLFVTMGIGSAFSTIPIVGSVLVPLGLALGFSPAAIAMLVSASAALGDSGSPASDQTLVPTAAFNMDGQHDHIRDTCLPSFLLINIPLIVVCAIAACFM